MPKVILKVRAIVEYRGKVLIIKEFLKRGYFWNIPGGSFEIGKDKDLISAIKRELFEEIGLKKVKIDSLMTMRQFNFNKDFIVEFIYKIKPFGSVKIKLGNVSGIKDEHIVEYLWIDAKDLRVIKPGDFCFANNYEMLKRFLGNKKK